MTDVLRGTPRASADLDRVVGKRMSDGSVTSVLVQGLTAAVDVGPFPPPSPDLAAAVYRTARESLANVPTHARAGNVWVRLEVSDHGGTPALLLEVCDDGVGLPAGAIDRRNEGGAVVTALLPMSHPE